MTIEQLAHQGRILLGLYAWLADDRNTAFYDVEKHNLCTAVIETPNGISQTFISYSNPSRLSNEMIESYEIVQDVSEDQKLIKIGGMAGLHTEIRLLNYIYVKGTERSVYNDLHPKISQSLWNIISYTDVAQRAPQNETFTWV